MEIKERFFVFWNKRVELTFVDWSRNDDFWVSVFNEIEKQEAQQFRCDISVNGRLSK